MSDSRSNTIIALATRQAGVVSTKDVEQVGIPRVYLSRLCEQGMLRRISHGLYTLPEPDASEYLSLIEVSKRVPKAVICLISALSFHEITTQIPHEVWIAVPRRGWRPAFPYPPLNVSSVSIQAYSFGVQTRELHGVPVNIYSPAKTVADCFKFRSKVGLDVAIEALKESWRQRKVNMDDLVEAAEICRVSKVIRPYLEAIV